MTTLKELVAAPNVVRFVRYNDGNLWYQVYFLNYYALWEKLGPEFPVPISDIGNATFLAEDKAILFMRYIRKHLKLLDEAQAANEAK